MLNGAIAGLNARLNDERSQVVTCSSGIVSLPRRAFDIPPTLQPLLTQLTVQRRDELHVNPQNLSAAALTASVAHLDLVDVDNTVAPSASPTSALPRLRVAEFNAQRGRFWCDIAVQIRNTPQLASVDVWLLNEFDLGMARSGQQHTARLLAYALGFNYAWGVEFIELTRGNRDEQRATHGQRDRYGLHGNAILSRWPLTEATIVRMPGMSPLYETNGRGRATGRPRDTAGGFEKRLGGRMTLFALTHLPAAAGVRAHSVTLGATHAQTSWRHDQSHTGAAIAAMRSSMAALAASHNAGRALIGGDTWENACAWLGLSALVSEKSPTALAVRGKVVLSSAPHHQDDYICARGFRLVSQDQPIDGFNAGAIAAREKAMHGSGTGGTPQQAVVHIAPAGRTVPPRRAVNASNQSNQSKASTGAMFVLSDHVFVVVNAVLLEDADDLGTAPSLAAMATVSTAASLQSWGQYMEQARSAPSERSDRAPLACDIVYRYVNPTALSARDHNTIANEQRFRDNGELRYSMRSFAAMAGVQHFYVIARGAPPHWLDTSHPRIVWSDELTLLERFRVQLHIKQPLWICNSEPSKLAITLLPGLGERFVLVDDDYFLVPQLRGLSPSTDLFFDARGLPLQPSQVRDSHRPIPFMRDAYFAAVGNESARKLGQILHSGAERAKIDLFGAWCQRMWSEHTARRVDMIQIRDNRCNAECHRALHGEVSLPSRAASGGGAGLSAAQRRSLVSFWLHRSSPTNSSTISAKQAEDFFAAVMQARPLLACINDDWPRNVSYASAIKPFHLWMATTYPRMAPWEKVAA